MKTKFYNFYYFCGILLEFVLAHVIDVFPGLTKLVLFPHFLLPNPLLKLILSIIVIDLLMLNVNSKILIKYYC